MRRSDHDSRRLHPELSCNTSAHGVDMFPSQPRQIGCDENHDFTVLPLNRNCARPDRIMDADSKAVTQKNRVIRPEPRQVERLEARVPFGALRTFFPIVIIPCGITSVVRACRQILSATLSVTTIDVAIPIVVDSGFAGKPIGPEGSVFFKVVFAIDARIEISAAPRVVWIFARRRMRLKSVGRDIHCPDANPELVSICRANP